MHEYAIAQDIVKRAVAEAIRHGATKVTTLHVKLGTPGSADPGALVFAVEAASQSTMAEGARVHITEAPEAGIVLESIELWEAPRCV